MFKFIASIIRSVVKGVWNDPYIEKFFAKHPKLKLFLKKRLTPNEKYGLVLTVGGLITLYFVYLFFGVVEDYYGRDLIIQSDLRILNLVQVLRQPLFNKIMIFITYLGGWPTVFAGVACVAVLLLLMRRWYHLVSLFIAVGLGELFVAVTKIIIARPRPPLVNALAPEKTYSFPSGHTFVAIVFYGLLAYFIFVSTQKRWVRIITVVSALLIILLIGFSRIYLGAHWPSDVLSSDAVGVAWLTALITALEIKRRFPRMTEKEVLTHKRKEAFTFGLIGVWLIFTIGFYITHPLKPITYSVQANTEVTESTLFNKLFDTVPKTSEDLSGQAMEPIDLIFVGTRSELENAFQKMGWQKADRISVKTAWKSVVAFLTRKPYPTAPGTPSFWNSVPNDFAYEKSTDKNVINEREHIHFWETNFIYNYSQLVWVATAHFDKAIDFKVKGHEIDPAIDKERDSVRAEMQQADLAESINEVQVVEPTLGQNQAGSKFFTDGKAYIVYLKNQ